MWEGSIICPSCNRPFFPKGDFQKTCYACWSQTPEGKAWRARKDAQRDGHAYREPPEEPRERTVYRDLPDFDLSMVRRMLQLCHPDKHDNSDVSVKVTQWLNDRLREMKGR